MRYAIYFLALVLSVSVWFIAVRAPLWLDETISVWQINAGFTSILSRQSLSSPAYSYILWFFTRILGTNELALRVPSILAMLGAAYLLHRDAHELFDSEIATIATIIFCLHPVVVFAAIDVRPYAFAALAINSSIFVLIRMRHNDSLWLAALLGFIAAGILYFHFLFLLILPSLAICCFLVKVGHRESLVRQSLVALATFTLAFLPTIPGLQYTFRTRATHVFDLAPNWRELASTLAPGWLIPIVLLLAFVAAATRRLDFQKPFEVWRACFCFSLGIIPILILYGISAATPIHVFADRYRMVAIPGIALCWGLIASSVNSRFLKLLFCIAVVATSALYYFRSPEANQRHYSWKYALAAVEKNASIDNAPVLICSPVVEADYIAMPVDSPKDSSLFAPLSYYKLSVPVVPLPVTLNQEAVQVALSFLQRPGMQQQRFLAMAYETSYPTLNWIANRASTSHHSRVIGIFDGVAVVEFTPMQR